MSGRVLHGWTKAAVYATALAAPLVLSGCASSAQTGAAANGGATAAATSQATVSAGGGGAGAGAAPSPATTTTTSAAPPLNATGGTKLTVSDGSSKILMDGRAVDFGTAVHDPAWTPDGKKVAFIDGQGNLEVANADGSGRVQAAKNPGGETWSHPTWQDNGPLPIGGGSTVPGRDFIFFGSSKNGGTLEVVSGTALDGIPTALELGAGGGEGVVQNPTGGNRWINVGGPAGAAVYEHDDAGTTEIYYRDDYLRQQGGKYLDNASEPAFFDTAVLGGDGSGLQGTVFVRTVKSGHKHIFLSPQQGAPVVDLTPNASYDCTEPAVSADGKTVAFSTPSGVETVGTGGGTPKKITDTPGFPAFR